MYLCISTYVVIYMYTYIRIHVCVHVCMYIRMLVSGLVGPANTHISAYVKYTYIYICRYTLNCVPHEDSIPDPSKAVQNSCPFGLHEVQ